MRLRMERINNGKRFFGMLQRALVMPEIFDFVPVNNCHLGIILRLRIDRNPNLTYAGLPLLSGR